MQQIVESILFLNLSSHTVVKRVHLDSLYANGSSSDSMPSSSIGRESMSLGFWWLRPLVLSRRPDDDAVGAHFDDHHVRARLDRLALRDCVDHLSVDFDGAAGQHFRASDRRRGR